MAYKVRLTFVDEDNTSLKVDVSTDGHFETSILPPPHIFSSVPLFDAINVLVALGRKVFDEGYVHEIRVERVSII